MQVPSLEDWEGVANSDDLDAAYAYKIFFGKSTSDVQVDFARNPIERTDELRFMPKVPFQYYIVALRDFVLDIDELDDWKSDAAACFISLAEELLESKPDFINPIYNKIESTLEFIANNQSLYDADEDIYGIFKSKMKNIRTLRKPAIQQI